MKRLDKGGFGIVYLPCRSTAGRSYQHDRSRQFPVINIPSRLHTQQEYPFREIANGYQQSVKNLFNNDPRPSRAIAARPRLRARLRLLLGSGRVHALRNRPLSRRLACPAPPQRGRRPPSRETHLRNPTAPAATRHAAHARRTRTAARRNGADVARNLHGADRRPESHLRRTALDPPPAPAPSPITERSRRVPRPKRSSGSDRPPCPAPPPETRPATRPERCETACRSLPHGQSLPEQAYAPVRTAINANS